MEQIESFPNEESPSERKCNSCGVGLAQHAIFCPSCGIKIDEEEQSTNSDVIQTLAPSFVYYFLTLIILAVYKLTSLFDDSFESLVIVTVVDVILVLFFWFYFSKSLAPLFSVRSVQIPIILKVIAGCIAGAVAVYYIADLINLALFDDTSYSYGIFMGTSHPELYAILFVCVQPAIFEEVAFRGFLFNNIQEVAPKDATVYITAVLFGIMHLAFLGLFYLIPIGIAFALLRSKYNTLWYGIIGHFIYNFTITALEYINLYYI